MAKEAALNLSTTEFDRPHILIDGEPYTMRSREEMSIGLMRDLRKLEQRVKGFQDAEDVDAKLEEMDATQRQMVGLIMVDEIPDEVHGAMTFGMYEAILRTFMELGGNANPSSETSS